MNYKLIFLYISLLYPVTLQEMYDNAESALGYDKYIELNQNQIYTGGIGIYEGSIYIKGNGAIIDLENQNGIWIYSDDTSEANLDIQYLSIINGAYEGLSYSGNATGSIVNCNFINNDYGIKVYDTCTLNITNCNFIDNSSLGFGMIGELTSIDLSYSNFWDNGDDILENCPGRGSIWSPWEAEEDCTGLLEDNPLFIDSSNYNYQYEDSSPCINSGNPNLLDPDNTVSDIGANFYNQATDCAMSGDVNNDNTVNILDVVEIVNFILITNEEYLECSDMNNDGTVDVIDIINLVNIILNR